MTTATTTRSPRQLFYRQPTRAQLLAQLDCVTYKWQIADLLPDPAARKQAHYLLTQIIAKADLQAPQLLQAIHDRAGYLAVVTLEAIEQIAAEEIALMGLGVAQ